MRASGGPRCEHCGARPLLYVPVQNRYLELELADQWPEPSRWHPFKRRLRRRMLALIHESADSLRAGTTRAIGVVPTPEEEPSQQSA